MATTVRIVVNVPGFNAYRNSAGVQALLGELAKPIERRYAAAAAAYGAAHHIDAPPSGVDVEVSVTPGRTRARARIHGASIRARLAEAHDRALLTALGGGA